jgi:uncharacterized repeat protein (TIGR03803 family)
MAKSKAFASSLKSFLPVILAVAMLPLAASAKPKFKVLKSVSGGMFTGLTLDAEGNLYGVTGGGGTHNEGTVFKLTHHPSGKWTETVLHSFDGTDGYSASGRLIFDDAGNLYGTAFNGGQPYYGGTVYELTPGAAGWNFKVLYSFCPIYGCPDGAGPDGLIIDKQHNLYGTTASGGAYDDGTVFELTPDSETWGESVLYSFGSRSHDGARPLDVPTFGAAGDLYATTYYGGVYGGGTVFELRHTSREAWGEDVLYNFCPGGAPCDDGQGPYAGLVLGGSGSLYGTTTQGGRNTCGETHCGTVYKLTPDPNGHWKETVLYGFPNPGNGSFPTGGVVRDGAGSLYGATVGGGTGSCSGGCGVAYKLEPQGRAKWKYSVLHRFDGSDGGQPLGGLILDAKGNLFGTAYDTVFEITQ